MEGQIEDAALTQTNVLYHVERRCNGCSREVQSLLVGESRSDVLAIRLGARSRGQSGGRTPRRRPQGARPPARPTL